MNESLLTIVLPFFHAEATIGRTLDSLIAQNVVPNYSFQVFVALDGCSTDFDFAQYEQKLHLQIFEFDHSGPLRTRVKAAMLSQTKFVYFLDCDDELLPRFFSLFCSTYEAIHFDVCLTRFFIEDSQTVCPDIYPSVIDDDVFCELLAGKGSIGYSACKVYSRRFFTQEVMQAVEKCDYELSEDLFLSMLLFRPGLQYGAINAPVYIYHATCGSLSSNMTAKKISGLISLVEERRTFVNAHCSDRYDMQNFYSDIQTTLVDIRKHIFARAHKNDKKALLAQLYGIDFLHAAMKSKPRSFRMTAKNAFACFLLLHNL